MELKYTGGFDGAQVYRRVGWNSSIREGLMELRYTGGFDRAQVYWRVYKYGGFDGAQVYRRV